MAMTTRIREVDAPHRLSEQQEQYKSLSGPLHSSCGACVYCADRCDNPDSKLALDSNDKLPCCGTQFYTMCEIRKHNTADSAWLVVGSDIYDVTDYISQHPGGKTSILKKSGGAFDCTEDFQFHSKHGRGVWQQYHVGKVKRCPGSLDNNRQWWMFWI